MQPPQREAVHWESALASLHQAAAVLDDLREDSYGLGLVREQLNPIDCGRLPEHPGRVRPAMRAPRDIFVTKLASPR